jgi:SAM-dependent methyltransferase
MMNCDDSQKKESEASTKGSSGTTGETDVAPVRGEDFWNERASEFSEYAKSTGYPEQFMALMRLMPDWSVLDMACGGGALAIPLAGKVGSVTAVDFSSSMLDIVRGQCTRAGITNVATIQGRWEDDWESLGIGMYDVAIASRSLIGDDPQPLIRKLDGAARRAVYITTVVGDGPFDRRLFEASGRRHKEGKDYIHFYNLLYKMGIHANVAFIREQHRNGWESHEQALEDQQWMFHGMTAGEREKVSAYLEEHLTMVDGLWRLPYSRDCQWALMWWSKESGE